MREKWPSVIAVGLVALGLMMYLVVYTVRVDQVAVHRRFGRVVRIVRPTLGVGGDQELQPLRVEEGVKVCDKAGFFLKLPWPFDTVLRYDQRIRVVDSPLAQTQLPDGNQLIPRVYAAWRITDPVAFEQSLSGDEQTAEKNLKQIISDQTGGLFGRYNLDDVVNTDPEKLKFDEIEERLLAGVRERLASSQDAYGIEVCSLGITWLALPEDATGAVFGRMETERRRQAETLRSEGTRIKDTRIAQARAEREKILAEADAQAKETRSTAEAEAARYYQTFAQDQDLAIFLRRLEAFADIAQAALEKNQPLTILLSTKTEPFGILERGPIERSAEAQQLPELPELPVLRGPEAAPSAVDSGEE